MWVRIPPAGFDGRRIPDAHRVQDVRRPGPPVPCFRRYPTDEIACPEPPHPPGRHCRSSERIAYALVIIHGGVAHTSPAPSERNATIPFIQSSTQSCKLATPAIGRTPPFPEPHA